MSPTPACEGNSSYWDKYYYFPTNNKRERIGHNKHHESMMREEVRALLSLYKVQVMGIVAGQVHVIKWFYVGTKGISAASDGPIDAPLEYWQELCKTLLDHAVSNGYKEPENGSQK